MIKWFAIPSKDFSQKKCKVFDYTVVYILICPLKTIITPNSKFKQNLNTYVRGNWQNTVSTKMWVHFFSIADALVYTYLDSYIQGGQKQIFYGGGTTM